MRRVKLLDGWMIIGRAAVDSAVANPPSPASLPPRLPKPHPLRDIITVLPPAPFYDVEVETWKMHLWHLPLTLVVAAPALPWLRVFVCVWCGVCVCRLGCPAAAAVLLSTLPPCCKTVVNCSIEQKDNLQNSDHERLDWTQILDLSIVF